MSLWVLCVIQTVEDRLKKEPRLRTSDVWHCLSRYSNVTWDIVQANPDKPWNWWGLSLNPSITWDIVQANPDKPWIWWGLSENPNITWDIV